MVINPPVYHPFFSLIEQLGRELAEVAARRARARSGRRSSARFAEGARALILCSPHNPTGAVPTASELERSRRSRRRHGAWVLADEIHAAAGPARRRAHALPHRLARRPPSAASRSPRPRRRSTSPGCIARRRHRLRARRGGRREAAVRRPRTAAISARSPASPPSATATPWLDDVHRSCSTTTAACSAELLAEHLPEVGYTQPHAGYLAWLDCARSTSATTPREPFLERGRVALSPGPSSAPGRGLRAAQLRHLPGPARGDRRADGEGGGPVSVRRSAASRSSDARPGPDGGSALVAAARPARPLRHPHPLRPQRPRRLPAGARRSCSRTIARANARAATFPMQEPDGYPAANDEGIAAAAGSDGRLVALCRVDPHDGALAEARRCLDAGARGIKLHPTGRAVHARRAGGRELVALADERRRAGPDPRRPRDPGPWPRHARARRAPLRRARLILAHARGQRPRLALALMPEHPNLLIDTSWWNPADLIALFRLVPPGQILWASDSPYGQPLHLRRDPPALRPRGRARRRVDWRRSPAARSSASWPARSRRRRPAARARGRAARPAAGAGRLAPADRGRRRDRRGRPERAARSRDARLRRRGGPARGAVRRGRLDHRPRPWSTSRSRRACASSPARDLIVFAIGVARTPHAPSAVTAPAREPGRDAA